MSKSILITGATDGIGFVTAEKLARLGHRLLIHGRNQEKLDIVKKKIKHLGAEKVDLYIADFSDLKQVEALASSIRKNHTQLDIIINNAGVYETTNPATKDNLDIRFVVNTFAPYLLTKALLPSMNSDSRVVNLASAAQTVVDIGALSDNTRIADSFNAYAQSKTALIMWSRYLSQEVTDNGPSIISVNPGSLLASKMVKEGFGVPGKDINIGADILVDISLNKKYENASGSYFDNDLGDFAEPHGDTRNPQKISELVSSINAIIKKIQMTPE